MMMENSRPEEEIIIKYIRNLFRLKRELNYTAIKDIRNLFKWEKETKAIKDKILRDVKNLFEHEEEDKIFRVKVRVNIFCSSNCIEYKCDDDKSKPLSVDEHFNKTRPFSKETINNVKKSDTW